MESIFTETKESRIKYPIQNTLIASILPLNTCNQPV